MQAKGFAGHKEQVGRSQAGRGKRESQSAAKGSLSFWVLYE